MLANGGTLTYERAPKTIVGNIQLIPNPIPAVSVFAYLDILEYRLWGSANAFFVVLGSFARMQPPPPFLPSLGWPELWIDPAAFAITFTGTLDNRGYLFHSTPVSAFMPPSVQRLPVVLQAVVAPPSGPLQLSTAATVVLNMPNQ